MAAKKIIIGTRGSELALAQTREVAERLGAKFQIKIIKTTGDKFKKPTLGKGIFTKELEEALLKGDIDLAVHSVKDLPTDLPKGLILAGVTKREDPHDCLITREKIGLKDLPKASRIGTGSLRRKAQLLNYRRDLEIVDIRGNITTRIKKLKDMDGIVLSVCGLKRLGLKDLNIKVLPYSIMLPAAGQGALGIEAREGDKNILDILEPINDPESYRIIQAERSILKEMGGGCQVPIGCLGTVIRNKVKLKIRIVSEDGTKKEEWERYI